LLGGTEEGGEEPMRLTVVKHSNQAFSEYVIRSTVHKDKAQAKWTGFICLLSPHTVLLVAEESY
jgi:hypothetical protein